MTKLSELKGLGPKSKRCLNEIGIYSREELEKIFNNSDRHLIKARCNEFEKIPGVGKKLSKDLVDLGYHKVIDLNGEDPELIYQHLIELRGRHIDRCVLYVFRCAVYYASNSVHEPELLKWWSWKDTE